MKCVIYFFNFLLLLTIKIEARIVPADSQQIAGVNVAGLHANLKTNLFAPDGPLALLGKEIASGTNQLENELNTGAEALKTDLQKAKNFMAQGSQEQIVGVNIGGLHAGIKSNLLSANGPLAQMEKNLAIGGKQLENDIAKGANALGASLTDAANAFQAQLANGLKDLGDKVPWPTAGVSLDDLLKGPNNLLSPDNIKPEESSKKQKDEDAVTGKALMKVLQSGNIVQTAGESSISGQSSNSNPEDLTDLFKNIQLPNICGNS